MGNEFEHFLTAQEPICGQVAEELRQGAKKSHWMWFIFPQLRGLGQSPTARYFAIQSLDQAKRYLAHPVLGKRIIDHTTLVLNCGNKPIAEIFEFPDNLKFHSCMTLFALASSGKSIFHLALVNFFSGQMDLKTVELLKSNNLCNESR